ncbi:hypothetical protein PV325_004018 [Microctonus aethiopoides]|nr:hypothetical protein PV325_004018 [Microctonus aethiopoides]
MKIDQPGKLENENNSWEEECEILPMLGCGTDTWKERLYCRGTVLDSQGPVLVSEPRSTVEFSNDTGAMLHCSAHGSPGPRVDWLMGDGSPVHPIPNIREMLVNGSMYFLPFGAESYRHDVHSAVYKCQASNSVGRVLGREVNVKAVVRQKYQVGVKDAHVLAGNTGVLRCDIPTHAKEYVAVTSWVQDSAFNIYPAPESGEKVRSSSWNSGLTRRTICYCNIAPGNEASSIVQ